MTAPTLDQQIASVKREIALRKNTYPKWVSNERMRQAEADHEIAAMTAALHTLMAVKRLRATMVDHWLQNPFGEGTQRAHCACSWTSPAASTLTEAVQHYLDHVFERSKAAAEADANPSAPIP